MKNKVVNVAIQVLPFSKNEETYALVDRAIEVIAASGVTYRVTPFETVLEGPYSVLMQVVADVQAVCFEHGADSVLCNLKIHSHRQGDARIADKMQRYK